MKTIAALLLAGLCSMPAIACDKVDAARMQLILSEMGAQWSEQGGRVALEWGWEWDGAAAAQRLGLLKAFAGGDACLTGQLRTISFYRNGKLVGKASRESGVQLLSDPPAIRTAAGLPATIATPCPD